MSNEKSEVTKKETAKKKVPKTNDTKAIDTNKKSVNNKKPMPLVLKVLAIGAAVLVVFVVAMFVITSQATKGAVSASDQFINALQAGDGAMAYSLLTSDIKEKATEEEFSAFVEQVGPILDTEENKISQEVSKEDDVETGQVVYVITGTDGIVYEISIELVKEDNDWKVSLFDSKTQKDEE